MFAGRRGTDEMMTEEQECGESDEIVRRHLSLVCWDLHCCVRKEQERENFQQYIDEEKMRENPTSTETDGKHLLGPRFHLVCLFVYFPQLTIMCPDQVKHSWSYILVLV